MMYVLLTGTVTSETGETVSGGYLSCEPPPGGGGGDEADGDELGGLALVAVGHPHLHLDLIHVELQQSCGVLEKKGEGREVEIG